MRENKKQSYESLLQGWVIQGEDALPIIGTLKGTSTSTEK